MFTCNIIMFTCNIIMFTCNIIMFTCNKIMFTCNIIMFICNIIMITCNIIMFSCNIIMLAGQGRSFLYAITQLLTHRNSSKKIEHISDSLRKKEKKWALLFQWRHNNSVIVNYDVLNFVTMLDFIFRLDIPCYLFCFVAFARSTGFNA